MQLGEVLVTVHDFKLEASCSHLPDDALMPVNIFRLTYPTLTHGACIDEAHIWAAQIDLKPVLSWNL